MYSCLRRVHNNLVQIRPEVILPVIQPTHRDSIIVPLLQRQLQWRRENDPLVRITLVQSLQIVCIPIDHDTANTAKLPCTPDTVGCTARLVAETLVVDVLVIGQQVDRKFRWWSGLTLVVEGHPLRLARSFNTGKGHGTVVAVYAGQNKTAACEVLIGSTVSTICDT